MMKRFLFSFILFVNACTRRDHITRVIFWDVSDEDSWKNNWPVRGRTNYPLLFDRDHQPKPAFYSIIEILQ